MFVWMFDFVLIFYYLSYLNRMHCLFLNAILIFRFSVYYLKMLPNFELGKIHRKTQKVGTTLSEYLC